MIPIGRGFRAQKANFTQLTATDGTESRKATSTALARGPGRFPTEPKPENFLSVGARPTPTEWIGLHSTQEAEKDYKPRSRLRPTKDATNAKELRHLHRGELGPELPRSYREILSLTRLSADGYFNGAFVRTAPDAEPI